MSTGSTSTVTFQLPEGWTLRKVANALVREWIPPFRAEPAAKAARWVVQPVVEDPGAGTPLWEAGISTEEYEERLERADLTWAIRASAGRGKHTILARMALAEDQPRTVKMVVNQGAFPEALFDAEKMDEFLAGREDGLFEALLTSNGFETTPV
jgi:hypothetical protein